MIKYEADERNPGKVAAYNTDRMDIIQGLAAGGERWCMFFCLILVICFPRLWTLFAINIHGYGAWERAFPSSCCVTCLTDNLTDVTWAVQLVLLVCYDKHSLTGITCSLLSLDPHFQSNLVLFQTYLFLLYGCLHFLCHLIGCCMNSLLT